jgi:hypothetical protein
VTPAIRRGPGSAVDRLVYATGKFAEAVYALVGAGETKARLREAFRSIGPVGEKDLPESLRAQFRALSGNRDRVLSNARLSAMRLRNAGAIAHEVFTFWRLLEEELNRTGYRAASPAASGPRRSGTPRVQRRR